MKSSSYSYVFGAAISQAQRPSSRRRFRFGRPPPDRLRWRLELPSTNQRLLRARDLPPSLDTSEPASRIISSARSCFDSAIAIPMLTVAAKGLTLVAWAGNLPFPPACFAARRYRPVVREITNLDSKLSFRHFVICSRHGTALAHHEGLL
jgi:hypothetical protein